MARLVRVVHTDDLDGTEGARPIEFSIGGDVYSVDLTEANAAKLRAALEPYIAVAEKVGRKRSGRSASAQAPRKGPSNSDVRDWARANGYKVSDRGRISAEIIAAYEAAN
ncbi:MAG: Lsr2 family protein [Propionibacteriaceae bacterium]|nr:Lsr2 family protein [Propionibacteriaceae bacterium]